MGAGRIFLIGFDMGFGPEGESNWHPNPLDDVKTFHYQRYMDEIQRTLSDITIKWPEVEIVNLNPDSKMECFPKKSWEVFLKEEKTDE
jgi:hypothetical protein